MLFWHIGHSKGHIGEILPAVHIAGSFPWHDSCGHIASAIAVIGLIHAKVPLSFLLFYGMYFAQKVCYNESNFWIFIYFSGG